MEKNLTENQSLKIIQEMIITAKGNLRENSFFYLLWGWLVLAACLLHYLLLQVGWAYAFLPWPVLMTAGGVASVVAGVRMGRRSRVVTHVDKMMTYLWTGFTVVLLLMISMALLQKLSWTGVYPLIIAMYGLGTFVSGGALKFKPLIVGGIASWIIALVAFMVPVQFILLLTALSVIVAYLVPGYMLKNKA